jgi:hypothetical protein
MKKYFWSKLNGRLLIILVLLMNGELPARDWKPLRGDSVAFSNFTPAMPTGLGNDGPKVNMLVLYAGAAAGGKQNTCYFLKSKITLVNKINLNGAAFFHLNGDVLYNAEFAFGNVVSFSAGLEWGDRSYYVNKDSTLELIRFKNTATGEYASYNSFAGIAFPQEVNAWTFGISFNARIPATNYWRGKGRCWTIMNFKWEGLYAPTVKYDEEFVVTTQGLYEEQTATYFLEGAKVKHWGFRLVVDTRLSSKIGFMMECGMRPGVKYKINEEGRFSNGYLRMGVAIGFAVGGRKALKAAEM